MGDTGFSSRAVDICATILSDTAPQLPLRQEYMSLGFEVVYNAEGVGRVASQTEAKKAVEYYRTREAVKELKKRRLFPKKHKRIREKLAETKRIEKELALPHGLSYEAYQKEMSRLEGASFNSGSKSGFSSSDLSDMDGNRKRLSWIKRRNYKKQQKNNKRIDGKTLDEQQATDGNANIAFPDYLAPIFDENDQSVPKKQFNAEKYFDVNAATTKEASDYTRATSSINPHLNPTNMQVEFVPRPETKQFYPGLVTVKESADNDETGYPMNSNPFSSSSSDVSELLNPFEDGAKFPDLLKDDVPRNQANQHSDPPVVPESIVAISDIAPSVYPADNETKQAPVTEPDSWIQESQKCLDKISTDLCHLVTDNKDQSEADQSTIIAPFSAFGDLSADLYNSAGMYLTKGKESAINVKNNCLHNPEIAVATNEWASIAKMVCGSTGLDACLAASTDTKKSGKEEYDTVPVTTSEKVSIDFVGLPATGIQEVAEEKKPDPPLEDYNKIIENSFSNVPLNLYNDHVFKEPLTSAETLVQSDEMYWGLDQAEVAAQKAELRAKTHSLKVTKDALQSLRKTPKIESEPPTSSKTSLTPQHLHTEVQSLPSSPTHITTQNSNIVKNEAGSSPTNGWITHAIQNITSEVYKAAGMETAEKNPGPSPKSTSQQVHDIDEKLLEVLSRDSASGPWEKSPTEKSKKGNDDIGALFSALSQKYPPMIEIERILTENPELVQVRQMHDGRMPLHAVCDRGMPDRSAIHVEALTDNLLRDIASYKRLIKLIVTLFPEACLVQDKKGDLPAHLIARGLMQWEAEWYEKVYMQASKEKGATGKTAISITKLYHNMSESVEMLLKPLASDSTLCQAPGSMGTILPLHTASIFTASVNTIRLMLEAYPEAAKVPCDLGILQTFIPDESLPLELHDNLSTDFPKWEIEAKQSSHPEVRWSQSELEQSQDEDCMRRSDLLFAYNPIEPHRFEKARMRRLEARIQFEAKRAVYDNVMKKINRATELVWIWMCTFTEPDSNSPTYVNSVKRIVNALPLPALKELVSVQTEDNTTIMEQANTECLKVIQKRLDIFSKTGASDEQGDAALADDMTEVTSVHSASDATSKSENTVRFASEFRLQAGRGFVSYLCRLIFNVHETSFPTSFVILPYKLALKEGKLRMASQDSLVVAAKFAECLLNLTDPRSILYFLNTKSSEIYDSPIYDTSIDEEASLETYTRVKGYEESLMALFESGEAYLYLLDDATGLPEVMTESVYPISLQEPMSFVRRLLPLMMMGMVQMRGEKAISKLAHVILDKKVSYVVTEWIDASNELRKFLVEKEEKESTLSPELAELKHALVIFQSKGNAYITRRHSKGEKDTEWVHELSLLKEILEEYDPKCEYLKLPSRNLDEANCDENAPPKILTNNEVGSVDALTRKLEELSELHLHVTLGQSKKQVDNESDGEDPKQRKNMISRYSMLFNELAVDQQHVDEEAQHSDEEFSTGGIKVWNAATKVWEDVTQQLESQLVFDEPEVTQLKVALAEQARKLAFLGKKVSALKDTEDRVLCTVSEEVISSLIEQASIVASKNDLVEARRLVLRMCDLEERLLLDEISIQHLSLETNMLNQEKNDMMELNDEPRELMHGAYDSVSSAQDDTEERSQGWKANEYVSETSEEEHGDVRYLAGAENIDTIPRIFHLNEVEPQEIVDLAKDSDDSEIRDEVNPFSFRNRSHPESIDSSNEGRYISVGTTRDQTLSTWEVSIPRESSSMYVSDIRSHRFNPTPSPIETFDLVDAEYMPSKLTIQMRTNSFSSTNSSTEIVDLTDMSDSSFTPERRVVIPTYSPQVLEVVDVTEMSVSHAYSTKSPARSGYSMTHGSSEVIDVVDLTSGFPPAHSRRRPLESRFDFCDHRNPPEIVSVYDMREEISPKSLPAIALNNSRIPPRPPSFGGDLTLGTNLLHSSASSSEDFTPSSTTALAANRSQKYVHCFDHTRPYAADNFVRINNQAPLSPCVIEIDKVISKYTKQPGHLQPQGIYVNGANRGYNLY